jgi:hypothetical protein
MQNLTIAIRSDSDIITAREKCRALAEQFGCRGSRLTLVSTVISGAARKVLASSMPGAISMQIARRGRLVDMTIVITVHNSNGTSGIEPSQDWEKIRGLETVRGPGETVLRWTLDCGPASEPERQEPTARYPGPQSGDSFGCQSFGMANLL